MVVSEKIKELRKKLKFSQREFALKIGVSRSILSQVEINKIKPSVEMIASISSIFNISPDYFFQNNPLSVNNFTYTKSFTEAPGKTCRNCERLFVINESQKEIIEGLKETVSTQQRLIQLLDEKLNKTPDYKAKNPV